jgi:mannose-6-phosphate isomerase-like protein (cupin superfamily)
VPLKAGQSYRRLANVQHDVKNGSDHPIAFIEIEIMRPDKINELPA